MKRSSVRDRRCRSDAAASREACLAPTSIKIRRNRSEACFEGLICIDYELWLRNGLEFGPEFFVEVEGAVLGGVRGAGGFEAMAGGFFRTDALDDAPGSGDAAGGGGRVLQLIGAGEGPAVEEDR